MRWFAAFVLFGSPFCDKRFAIEAQPPVTTPYEKADEKCLIAATRTGMQWRPVYGTRTVLRSETCQHVVEHFARGDGMYYAKEHDDCGYDYLMQGPCT